MMPWLQLQYLWSTGNPGWVFPVIEFQENVDIRHKLLTWTGWCSSKLYSHISSLIDSYQFCLWMCLLKCYVGLFRWDSPIERFLFCQMTSAFITPGVFVVRILLFKVWRLFCYSQVFFMEEFQHIPTISNLFPEMLSWHISHKKTPWVFHIFWPFVISFNGADPTKTSLSCEFCDLLFHHTEVAWKLNWMFGTGHTHPVCFGFGEPVCVGCQASIEQKELTLITIAFTTCQMHSNAFNAISFFIPFIVFIKIDILNNRMLNVCHGFSIHWGPAVHLVADLEQDLAPEGHPVPHLWSHLKHVAA